MRYCFHLFAIVAMMSAQSCHRSPRLSFDASQPHFHIFSKGGWSIDADYLVLPDDTFHYRSFLARSGEIDLDGKVKIPGLFNTLIRIADENQAWAMTQAAMAKEIADAHASIQIYDASHDYLSFRAADRFLTGELDGSLGFPSSSSHPLADAFKALRRALYAPTNDLMKSLAK